MATQSRSKKVVLGVKELLKSAKTDFKENSASLKQDVKDVLEAARLKRRVGRAKEGKVAKILSHSYNPDAGSEILSHYKEQWREIHLETQETSQMVSDSEVQLQSIHKSLSQSHSIFSHCCDEFSLLPEVVKAVETAKEKVTEVGNLLEKVEESITEYSRVLAQLECERRQHSLKIQQDMHKKTKEDQLQILNNAIAAEKRSIAEREREIATQKVQDRQQAFQEMFNQQMKEYRKKGEIEKPIGAESRERTSSQLEDIVIEDEDGTASLHEFLSDVVTDDQEPGTESHKQEQDEAAVDKSDDGRVADGKSSPEEVLEAQVKGEADGGGEKKEGGGDEKEEIFEDAQD